MYGLNSKIHLIVDVHDMPVKISATAEITVDYVQACRFVRGIDNFDIWTVKSMEAIWKKCNSPSI